MRSNTFGGDVSADDKLWLEQAGTSSRLETALRRSKTRVHLQQVLVEQDMM